MAVVYQHRRLDTNEVFYIGIGNETRPYRDTYRNKYWHNIVNKYGYEVDILYSNISKKEAALVEINLIKELGRKDLGKGCLCNMTDGGELGCNRLVSKATKNKMSKAKLGKKLNKTHRNNISKSLKNNPPFTVKVIHIATGKMYKSIKEASKDSNFSYTALRAQLNNQNPNISGYKKL